MNAQQTAEEGPEPLTAESVRGLTDFSLYVKTARTLISDRTFPPGTTFQTPEGLRAEDEDTRAALDVQGGVYPIRESVFAASYALSAPTPEAAGLRIGLAESLRAWLDSHGEADIEERLAEAAKAWLGDEGPQPDHRLCRCGHVGSVHDPASGEPITRLGYAVTGSGRCHGSTDGGGRCPCLDFGRLMP